MGVIASAAGEAPAPVARGVPGGAPPPAARRWLAAWLLLNLLILGGAIGWPVWSKVGRHCYHAYDLGIYAQAIEGLARGEWNPRISIHGMRIFNDHFDPVLFLAAPLARWFRAAYVAVGFDLGCALLSALPLFWLGWRGRLAASLAAAGITYALLNRGLVSALEFPAHPVTWAVFPAALLGAACLRDRRGLMFASLTLLFLCKEEFPFAGLCLGAWYVWRGERRFGGLVAAWSAVWIAVAFGLRPLLLGPTYPYGGWLAVRMRSGMGMLDAEGGLDLEAARRLLECLAPLLPLAWWTWRSRARANAPALVAAAPLVAVRALGGIWKHHYLAPVDALLLAGTLPSGGPRPPRRIAAASIALTLLSLAGPLQRGAAFAGGEASPRCPPDPGRLEAIERAGERLLAEAEGKALVGGNLAPLLAARPDLYPLGGRGTEGETFRFVLVEKPPAGEPWPLAPADVRDRIARWRAVSGASILRDDRHLFFAEGAFRE